MTKVDLVHFTLDISAAVVAKWMDWTLLMGACLMLAAAAAWFGR
jgi:hypothetical protein